MHADKLRPQLKDMFRQRAEEIVTEIEMATLLKVRSKSSGIHNNEELAEFYNWLDSNIRELKPVLDN